MSSQKRRQHRQIWYVNDGVMLRRKFMQLKRIQAMKESTQGLNNYLGIKITSSEMFVKNKNKKGKFGRRDLPIINQTMLVD